MGNIDQRRIWFIYTLGRMSMLQHGTCSARDGAVAASKAVARSVGIKVNGAMLLSGDCSVFFLYLYEIFLGHGSEDGDKSSARDLRTGVFRMDDRLKRTRGWSRLVFGQMPCRRGVARARFLRADLGVTGVLVVVELVKGRVVVVAVEVGRVVTAASNCG